MIVKCTSTALFKKTDFLKRRVRTQTHAYIINRWFLLRRQGLGEAETALRAHGAGTVGTDTGKTNLTFTSHTHTHNCDPCSQVSVNSVKLLEENTGENLSNCGRSKGFLGHRNHKI